VEVTSREYTQTRELLELHRIDHTPIGRHGGASRTRKLVRLMQRTPMMRRFGKRRDFDLAVAHGSYDLAMAARSLGIPEVNMHDYEFAITQHRIACRLASRVIFPDSVPAERLRRFGVGPEKLFQYPGLKEEYYLADFKPDPGVLERLGVDTRRVVVIVRPPPDVSLYHRRSNPLFEEVLSHLGGNADVHAVVLPRTDAQRSHVESLGLPSVIVAERTVEAQSLVALADVVVSAGGTMYREAAALGTPVYTTFKGRLGGVDEALIRSGRLRRLADPGTLALEKRGVGNGKATLRDPSLLVDLILGTVE
jgi:predicted glycosyltransferase